MGLSCGPPQLRTARLGKRDLFLPQLHKTFRVIWGNISGERECIPYHLSFKKHRSRKGIERELIQLTEGKIASWTASVKLSSLPAFPIINCTRECIKNCKVKSHCKTKALCKNRLSEIEKWWGARSDWKETAALHASPRTAARGTAVNRKPRWH